MHNTQHTTHNTARLCATQALSALQHTRAGHNGGEALSRVLCRVSGRVSSYPRSHTHKSILAPRGAGMQDLTPRTLPSPHNTCVFSTIPHRGTASKIHEEMRVKYIRVAAQRPGRGRRGPSEGEHTKQLHCQLFLDLNSPLEKMIHL